MRVCILTETYAPVVGGGERQAQTLASTLSAAGVRTCVMTRRSDAQLPTFEMINGTPVYRIPPPGRGGVKRWVMLLHSFRALVQRRRDFDLLFVSGYKSLGLSAVLVSRALGKACVLKADSNGEMSGAFFAAGLRRLRMTPDAPFFRACLAVRNAILRRADAFVAITAGIRAELLASGVPAAAIHDLPNSVDTARFCPASSAAKAALREQLGFGASDVIVIYTGRLVSYKGLPGMVRVVAGLLPAHPRLKLLLIGSGGLDTHNCEDDLRTFVREHGLDASIRFTGAVQNVHHYLQASDIFALPTEDDAFPLSLVEAMACGLAVVATRVGGIPAIVTDEHDGLLVPPGRLESLQTALERLIVDAPLTGALGAAATATVRHRFSEASVAPSYLQLFMRLTAHRPG